MVTKREGREQSSLDREGFSKGLREMTVVRRRKNLDLETCRQASMALGPRKFSKRLFQDYMRTLVGRGNEFSVIQPGLAENIGVPVLCRG